MRTEEEEEEEEDAAAAAAADAFAGDASRIFDFMCFVLANAD